MKILQINTWQGRLLRPLLNLISQEAPDIICAQEIYSYPEVIELSSPWNYFSTLETIAAQSNFDHTYFSPASTYPLFGRTVSFGNAILSKYPLSHESTIYTADAGGPIHQEEPSGLDSNRVRNFQHVQIETPRQSLNLINHHGHWVNQPLGDDTSVERLQLVARYIKKLEDPIIACGDFNLQPDSTAIKQFLQVSGLTSAFPLTPQTTTLSSAHYLNEPIVCDYILLSSSLRANQAVIHDELVSDHRALIVELDA